MATTVCLTFDVDALSLWIGTFGKSSAAPLSRGEYGVRVGVPRILDMLARKGLAATFFVPGHTARTFPDAVAGIANGGHEIGCHNDVHESPVGLDKAQEAAILERAERVLGQAAGCRPVGYRSPAFDLGPFTLELLEERGYLYDSSLMADDFRPYRPRMGDRVDAQGDFHPGQDSAVWEFPVAWELDDFPYFQFMGKGMVGLRDPEEVGAIWRGEFDACRRYVADGVFNLTCHPQVIGRGPRMAMLESLVEYMQSQDDVTFSTLADRARLQPAA